MGLHWIVGSVYAIWMEPSLGKQKGLWLVGSGGPACFALMRSEILQGRLHMGLKHICIGQGIGIEQCKFDQKQLRFGWARLIDRGGQGVVNGFQIWNAQSIGDSHVCFP